MSPPSTTSPPPGITFDQLNHLFGSHHTNQDQQHRILKLKSKFKELGVEVLLLVPKGPTQTVMIRHLVTECMNGVHAISNESGTPLVTP
jgi:hypothetical protein